MSFLCPIGFHFSPFSAFTMCSIFHTTYFTMSDPLIEASTSYLLGHFFFCLSVPSSSLSHILPLSSRSRICIPFLYLSISILPFPVLPHILPPSHLAPYFFSTFFPTVFIHFSFEYTQIFLFLLSVKYLHMCGICLNFLSLPLHLHA